MGAKIDQTINRGSGPYLFNISGQLHHLIGSLVPSDDTPPRFIQLYICDTDNEFDNRIRALDVSDSTAGQLGPLIVSTLMCMLDEHSPLVRQFQHARDCLRESGGDPVGIRIIRTRPSDPIQYDLPSCDDLVLLVVGNFSLETYKQDIVVHNRSRDLCQISPFHPTFMAL